MGIRPPSEKPSDILLSAHEVQGGLPAGTFVADVDVESEATAPVYEYELHGKYSNRTHSYQEAAFDIINDQLFTNKELKAGSTQEVTIKATNVSNGGSVERTFRIVVTDGPNGVNDVTVVPVGAKLYYSTSGMQLTTPAKGLNIIRQCLSDGTTKTMKVFKK